MCVNDGRSYDWPVERPRIVGTSERARVVEAPFGSGCGRPSVILKSGIRALPMGIALAASLMVSASVPTFGATATPAHGSTEFVRGAYGKDGSSLGFDVMAATGFNSVMTGPYRELLDPLLPRGLKGVVWLGNWLNAPTCGFQRSDAAITSLVTSIAGHPAILAYYLGDEPHVSECPSAPELFKKRGDLVHSLDPGSTTFTVIQASENGVQHDYAPWAGTVDIIGFDVYPCRKASAACDFGLIDAAVRAIGAAGVKRYWAIMQDFQDCYYRLPTPAELRTQFEYWSRSNMSGYFVFSWNYQPADPKCVGAALGSYPQNLAELKTENAMSLTSSASTSGGQRSGSPPANLFAIALISALVLIGAGALAIQLRTRRTR
jgi:hypothetical protein